MVTVVTTRVDDDTLAGLDRLAGDVSRSRSWLVAEAVKRYVAEQLQFRAFLQAGMDDVEAGNVVTQEEMEEWFENRHRAVAAE